jgi:hypothetical protein
MFFESQAKTPRAAARKGEISASRLYSQTRALSLAGNLSDRMRGAWLECNLPTTSFGKTFFGTLAPRGMLYSSNGTL